MKQGARAQAPPEALRLVKLKHLWLGLCPMTEMPLEPAPLQQLEWLCALPPMRWLHQRPHPLVHGAHGVAAVQHCCAAMQRGAVCRGPRLPAHACLLACLCFTGPCMPLHRLRPFHGESAQDCRDMSHAASLAMLPPRMSRATASL